MSYHRILRFNSLNTLLLSFINNFDCLQYLIRLSCSIKCCAPTRTERKQKVKVGHAWKSYFAVECKARDTDITQQIMAALL